MNTASELMVRDICYAELDQPISYIRQRMLVNAFSYLPVRANGTVEMLSDVALAKWLRQMDWEEEAKALAQTLAAARKSSSKLALTPATVLSADTLVNELVEKLSAEPNHAPVLLHRPDGKGDIVGLISAFDLL
jgi:CBS-domain-containing membrane protein